MGQNYYAPDDIQVGAQLTVPLICACPTQNQTNHGVSSLLVHTLRFGDTIGSIGLDYGVDQQILLDANQLLFNETSSISAFTPILVPLQPNACKLNPHAFYCNCSRGSSAPTFDSLFCDDHSTLNHRFPFRFVASLGNY